MSSFSRTPSRLGRLKAQVKTVLSHASSSGTKPSLIKRHTAPADIGLPRVSVPPRHARTHSERDPRDYRYAHPEGASAYLDPYSSVHLHPSVSGTVRAPRHRSEEYYSGVSPLTPDAYALLDDYFPSSAPSRASSRSRTGTGSTPASTRTSPTSSRANSYAPALSAFARPSRPSSRTGSSPTSSRANSCAPALSTFARPTPSRRTRPAPVRGDPRTTSQPTHSYASAVPRDKAELAAVLADPYYHHAGARPPSRPHGARTMPNAAVVPVYVNVYGTKGRRGWLGVARRK